MVSIEVKAVQQALAIQPENFVKKLKEIRLLGLRINHFRGPFSCKNCWKND